MSSNKLDPLAALAGWGIYPSYYGSSSVVIPREKEEYLYVAQDMGIIERVSYASEAQCQLLYKQQDMAGQRTVASFMLEILRYDIRRNWATAGMAKPFFNLDVLTCGADEVEDKAAVLLNGTLKHHLRPPTIVTLTRSGDCVPGIVCASGEEKDTSIVLAFKAFPITLARTGDTDSRVAVVLRTSGLAIFEVLAFSGAAAAAAAVNDHTCPGCGNTRCSRAEKTCWRCGRQL